jgi:hypothetical protein
MNDLSKTYDPGYVHISGNKASHRKIPFPLISNTINAKLKYIKDSIYGYQCLCHF